MCHMVSQTITLDMNVSINFFLEPFYPPTPSYTEKGADELTPPDKYSPDNHADDSIQTADEIPVRHRQRAPRLAGLTARFYRHRRSASMSAYDTRPFKRGEQLYASENRGRMERSGFYHYGQGKTDAATAKVRASVREGTEVIRMCPDYGLYRIGRDFCSMFCFGNTLCLLGMGS